MDVKHDSQKKKKRAQLLLIRVIFIYERIYSFGLPKYLKGFPGSSDGKELACNARDLGLIPGLGRSPGEGNGSLKGWDTT